MRELTRAAAHQLVDLVFDFLEERTGSNDDTDPVTSKPRSYRVSDVDKARLRRELGAAGWPKKGPVGGGSSG